MPMLIGQEQAQKHTGYAYGSPGQMAPPISGRMHEGDDGAPPADVKVGGTMNGWGCLFAPFAALVALVLKRMDLERVRLEEETERYRIQADWQAVRAQASHRLSDTLAHLEHGYVPGTTKHDMDRTSWGVSETMEEPSSTVNVTADGRDPFTVDLGPESYEYKKGDDGE